MSKTVRQIVNEYLKKNGYDGLTDQETGCFCSIDSVCCDGDISGFCQAAYDRNGKISTEGPAAEQKTITVRIAVAVDFVTGDWRASGNRFAGCELSDTEKIYDAARSFGNDAHLCWIEAVIPIPESPVIVGTVTEGENENS